MAYDAYGVRSYSTRGSEEQRRTAAPAFTGRVRGWEKRWVAVGHLTVLQWVCKESEEVGAAPAGGGRALDVAAGGRALDVAASDDSQQLPRAKRSRPALEAGVNRSGQICEPAEPRSPWLR